MVKVNRKMMVLALVMIALVVTVGTAFAYWASEIAMPNEGQDGTGSVIIGEGGTTQTQIALGQFTGSDMQLVPVGRASTGGEIESAQLSVTVDWSAVNALDSETVNAAQGTLVVVLTSVEVGESVIDIVDAGLDKENVGEFKSLFEITATDGTTSSVLNASGASATFDIAGNVTKTIIFTVVLNEPATQAIYAMIAGESVSFNFSFTIAGIGA